MAVAMSSFLSGSVTVTSSYVGADLRSTTAEITWLVTAPSLTSGAFLLFFGSIADLFGRKTLFVGSLFLFSIVCAGTGFAKSGLTLDILTGVLGVFSASAVPPAQGMLGVIYKRPSKRKNRAFGAFSAGNPLGYVCGTILSGLAAKISNWRASLWLLAIVYFVIALVAVFTVPNDSTAKTKLNRETLKRLDLPGTAMTIIGIGMFCAALREVLRRAILCLGSDAPKGWKTPYVLVLLMVGLFILAAFILWELRYPYAMIDMSIWRDRDFSLLLITMCLGFIGFQIVTFWIALYFQVEQRYSSLDTGVHMLPMVIMGLLANAFAALIQHRVSNKLLMAIGALAYLLSFILAAAQRKGDSYWAFSFPALCLCVVGADFQFVVANMYVLSSMPAHRQSIAGSLFQTLSRLCGALGYGTATAIFNAVKRNPGKFGYYKDNAFEPYAACFWFAAGMAGVGLCFCPWLTVGTQGGKAAVEKDGVGKGEERVRVQEGEL
ncbi:MFS general substrate transporter [Sporormia fimetaria CBS 119925]|uniref:MFS general substrate transporter n=1 Tax=Sporormia fimetaria CBS 119925 TaxID=1340428 RepID=A0A6A6V296_9PLEO|nr:MFS general substrate transporter [Sporormia fimetaria CBS 119925]